MKNGKYMVVVEYGGATNEDKDLLRQDFGIVPNPATHSSTRYVMSAGHISSHVKKQVKFDLSFLHMAKVWAQNSHAGRKKVGCLIVRDYSVISDGYNGTPSGFDNKCEDEHGETKWEVLHAEANAISKLAKSDQSSLGATLYTTFSPCKDCAKLVLQAGIKRLVFSDLHSDTDGLELLAKAGVEISRYFPPNILVVHKIGKGEMKPITLE